MEQLHIVTIENGFIVFDGETKLVGGNSRSWAFETAESLAKFVGAWGNENTKTISEATVIRDENN